MDFAAPFPSAAFPKHGTASRSPRACLVSPSQEARKQKAAEGKQKLADREADYKQREKDLKDMKANTKAKVDDDVNDDMIDVDGDGVADMTAGVSVALPAILLSVPYGGAPRLALTLAVRVAVCRRRARKRRRRASRSLRTARRTTNSARRT